MNNVAEDLKVVENQNLNEEAEYKGSKQDLEQMLLEAQRYLNIFHQIHIFKDNKKAEFEQSLIDMPEKVRSILLNLPGGRVLLEYIEDCEVKRGLRTTRTIFGNENPLAKSEKESENKSAVGKELTQAISEMMAQYNQNMLQMNEKILNNSNQTSGGNKGENQAKILADALRDNSQQQMEMMKTFGSTLSQAILMSQKEIFSSIAKQTETNPIFNDSVKKNSSANPNDAKAEGQLKKTNPQIPEKNANNANNAAKPAVKNVNANAGGNPNVNANAGVNHNQQNENKPKTKPAENFAKQNNNIKPEIPAQQPIKTETVPDNKPEIKIENKPVSVPEVKTQPVVKEEKPVEKTLKENYNDIEINNFLTDAESEKAVNKPSAFGAAMQKIKNAITEPADISLDDLNIRPISLNDNDDLTNSLTDAFKEDKKEMPTPPAASQNNNSDAQNWEYVDEDGNPIDPNEWEYVDEDGNPIDPSEWEYVDENGNPVDPGEWEYVDENGNPVGK